MEFYYGILYVRQLFRFIYNSYVAPIQIPASGGNGSDYWYFMFAALPSTTWLGPLTIGIYIIEMQEIAENETSSAITLYNSQEFLFKVNTTKQKMKKRTN